MIRGAAAGEVSSRERFARIYGPVVGVYLGARWRGSPLRSDVDDAAQDVFVDCFKQGGALERADPARSFRAFLYGVVRFVALRFEERHARQHNLPSSFDAPADDDALSVVFDRAWAKTLMAQAAELQAARAATADAKRRFDLLRLRFQDGVPIRDIAKQWGVEARHLHHEYEKARAEFRRALLDVVGRHHGGSPGEIEREAERLVALF